jgi:hypothetical protein
MSVSCECCVLSGRGLCDKLVPRPEESYRVWCVYKVWSWSLEKWGGLGPQGAVEPLEKIPGHCHKWPWPVQAAHIPCLKSHIHFPLLKLYQRISPGPRLCQMFRNMVIVYGEELLAPRPTPKLKNHPLSAVHDCLFNVFAATLRIRRPFFHSQPEDAPCRGDRDPLIVGSKTTR